MALIYDSSHSGQEIDAAVDAVQTTIPSQLTQIGSKIGDLANLQTADKSSLVAAVNEVKSSAGGIYNLIENNHSSAMSLAQAILHIPTDKYQVGLHIIFNESGVGVVEYQFTDATISNITNASYWEAIPHTETAGESLVTSDDLALESDLDILDEEGFVIVRFSGGHIKTKYFDSSQVETDIADSIIARFKDKHIAIVGDSISTFSGYIPSGWRNYYTTSNLGSVNNTYWIKVCNALGMTYNNCAYSNSRVSGNSLATAADVTGAANQCAGCSDVRIDALDRDGKTPDIILIALGTNDWGNNVAIGTFDDTSTLPEEGTISTFAPAYALMLYKMQVAYPNAQIFCCTILPRLSGDVDGLATPPCINSGGVSLNAYNNKIKEIANIFGCNVIDLFACGLNFVNIASYAVDSTLHPNANGHTLMANKIIAELKAKY